MTPSPTFKPTAPRRKAAPPGTARLGLALLAAVLAVTAGLAGCASSEPDRYYTLAETQLPPSATAAVRPAAEATFIELAPLIVPDRLARPQFVVRRAGPTAALSVLEGHRWASSFEAELRDALAGGVAARLGAIDVSKGAPPSGARAWRIAVRVARFEAVEASQVDASYSWSVRRADADTTATCQAQAQVPVTAPGIEPLAEGAQRVSARMADAIAAHVRALQSDPGAACPAG